MLSVFQKRQFFLSCQKHSKSSSYVHQASSNNKWGIVNRVLQILLRYDFPEKGEKHETKEDQE